MSSGFVKDTRWRCFVFVTPLLNQRLTE